ncbi:hypothetical protein [Nocardia farcinica]|nr:hypothetical protein [Nocardia farcinica]
MTVELFLSPTVPATVDAELAERLLRTLTTEDGAPEQVLGKARELTHVVVHRPARGPRAIPATGRAIWPG